MSVKEDACAQLRSAAVAIAADDLRVSRVLGSYLLDHGLFASCAAYSRGRDLLWELANGAAYPVVVLDERLPDMIAEEFVPELAALELPCRPAVFVLTRYRYRELYENLSPYGGVHCLARMTDPERLAQAIRSWCSSTMAQLPNRCALLLAQWGVQQRHRDCAYLTDAVSVVLENRDSRLLRKQVMSDTALRHGVQPGAVESALQRLLAALRAEPTVSYLAFLQRHALQPHHITPIRLINALAEELDESPLKTTQNEVRYGT